MSPCTYALIAMAMYAISNVIIDRRLTNISPIANAFFFSLGIIGIALPILLLRGPLGLNVTFPQGNQYFLLALCGVLIFVADFCYFSAYYHGGSLILITTIITLIPVIASLVKFLLDGSIPSPTQIIGCILAMIAVFLVTR